jgi:hypothetical protein
MSSSNAPCFLVKARCPTVHLSTAANSGSVCCAETTTNHHNRLSTKRWLRPQSRAVSWSLFLPPVLHRQLPCEQIRYVYVPSHFYHPHFLLFELFNNPADSVSRWCNINRNPSTILSLQRHENHQRSKTFWWHLSIYRMRHHLVTQFSVTNGNKRISQVCRTMCDSCTGLCSLTQKFYNIWRVGGGRKKLPTTEEQLWQCKITSRYIN